MGKSFVSGPFSIAMLNNQRVYTPLSDWWFQTFFSIIYGIILPIDYYFSRWLKPPTSSYSARLCQMYQICSNIPCQCEKTPRPSVQTGWFFEGISGISNKELPFSKLT